MTTLTQTGSIGTILSLDMETDIGDVFGTLANDFCTAFFNVDALNQSSTFEFSTHTATSVVGYSPLLGGELTIAGTGLNINYSLASIGTYTSATFQSGADPGSGAFTYDGNESFHITGLVKWSFTPGDGGPQLTGGGLSTIDYTNGTDHFELIGTNLRPDETDNQITGLAKTMILTHDGVTLTLISATGVDLEHNTGNFSSIKFDDGVHDTITLAGVLGADAFLNGDHTLVGDYFNDSLVLSGADVLTVSDGDQDWHGWGGADKITGGAGDDNLFGDDGADVVTGNGGNDTLDGGTGADVMIGGFGDDTYFVDNALDKITEAVNAGNDIVYSTVSHTLAVNVEMLALIGTDNVNGKGNALVNIITGNGHDNTLDGVLNAGVALGLGDTLIGGDGNDTCILHSANDVASENGGEGNDTLVIAYNNAGPGRTSIDVTGTNFENIKITGTGAFDIHGDANANVLTGNSSSSDSIFGGGGNDVLDGGLGADFMMGGAGNDTFVVDNVGDLISTGGGSDTVMLNMASGTFTMTSDIRTVIMGGIGALHVIGNNFNDHIVGNAGANVIDGSAGGDAVYSMEGGAGADTFMVSNGSDVIVESTLVTGGIDLIISTDNFDLSTHGQGVEKLTLNGGFTGTGNDLNNVITGNANNNVLSGGAGADTLNGNDGNDTLDGGTGIDALNGGLGDDTYLVDLVLSGTLAKIQDIVTDTGGTDTLELRSAGLTLTTPTTLILGATLENFDISATGSDHLNISGNTLANHMTGNDWDNTLNGLGGADSMDGGNGNDTYIIDNAGDTVNDTGVTSSSSDTAVIGYAAAVSGTTADISDFGGVENIKITGTGLWTITGDANDNHLTGNASVNTLTGGGGNDVLDGGVGADTMTGGAGNDTFFVDNQADVVTGNGGTDTVSSSISFSLFPHADVLNLTLTGTALVGIGNTLGNVLTGNAAANTLTGDDGNDTLFGGAGADKLFGGNGNDTFDGGAGLDTITGGAGSDVVVFHSAQTTLATNADTIADFHTALGDNDALDINDVLTGYTGGPLADYVHLTQSGLNTIVSIDADGLTGGAHFINIATLTGVTASTWADADAMQAAGNLLFT